MKKSFYEESKELFGEMRDFTEEELGSYKKIVNDLSETIEIDHTPNPRRIDGLKLIILNEIYNETSIEKNELKSRISKKSYFYKSDEEIDSIIATYSCSGLISDYIFCNELRYTLMVPGYIELEQLRTENDLYFCQEYEPNDHAWIDVLHYLTDSNNPTTNEMVEKIMKFAEKTFKEYVEKQKLKE